MFVLGRECPFVGTCGCMCVHVHVHMYVSDRVCWCACTCTCMLRTENAIYVYVHVNIWVGNHNYVDACDCVVHCTCVGQRIPVCGCVRACAYMYMCVRGSARVCVCAGERQRESEEGDVGRVGQTRDVGWVRGFTRAHAANVSAVPNAVQQSGAQALSAGGPARSGVESAVRGCGLWVAGAGGLGPLPGGRSSPGHSRPFPLP